MHRQRDVGHDRLRPRRRDFDESSRLLDQLVAHIVERGFLRGRDHFLVGERGQGDRVPVHHPTAAIDQPLLVKIDKGALHRARHNPSSIVKRSRDQSQEQPSRFSCSMMMPPCLSFHSQTRRRNSSRPRSWRVLLFCPCADLLFDHGLRGDPGVIGARQPEHFLAQHARAPGEDVLDGVVQDVPKGEHAGDVRRRDDDGIRRLGRSGVGRETSRRPASARTISPRPPAVRKPWKVPPWGAIIEERTTIAKRKPRAPVC